MKKVLNFGSLNIDRVYRVDNIVKEGETIAASEFSLHPGGKGLNQSIALAKAGANVYHAGGIGADGQILSDILEEANVNIELIERRDAASGHAVIQVDHLGQNCIVISPGANHGNTASYVNYVLQHFQKEDLLLLQNEIDCNERIIAKAKHQGMTIAFNPSPINDAALSLPLDQIDCFIVNEHEAMVLANMTESPSATELLLTIGRKYPKAMIVLTLGDKGSLCYTPDKKIVQQKSYSVETVDTTGAGDTFTGFFLAAFISGKSICDSLKLGAAASALAVTSEGAAPSIPTIEDVQKWLES